MEFAKCNKSPPLCLDNDFVGASKPWEHRFGSDIFPSGSSEKIVLRYFISIFFLFSFRCSLSQFFYFLSFEDMLCSLFALNDPCRLDLLNCCSATFVYG